mmetsp:Transcript_115184/g.306244  ORF Transcript_115184/g.306244 Transcript_115184/m.306244 type:complete len:226 (-) Transcript_115184:1161-1838(-)
MVSIVEVSSPNRQDPTRCRLLLSLPRPAIIELVAVAKRLPAAADADLPRSLPHGLRRLAGAEGGPLRFERRPDAPEHVGAVGVIWPDAPGVEGLRLAGVLHHVEEQRHRVVRPSAAGLVAPAEAWCRAEVGLILAIPHRRWDPPPLVAPPVEEEEVVPGPPLRLQEHLRHVLAVIDAVGIHVHAGKLAQRGEHVHAADDLARPTVRLDLPLPVGEGGGADAALPS